MEEEDEKEQVEEEQAGGEEEEEGGNSHVKVLLLQKVLQPRHEDGLTLRGREETSIWDGQTDRRTSETEEDGCFQPLEIRDVSQRGLCV